MGVKTEVWQNNTRHHDVNSLCDTNETAVPKIRLLRFNITFFIYSYILYRSDLEPMTFFYENNIKETKSFNEIVCCTNCTVQSRLLKKHIVYLLSYFCIFQRFRMCPNLIVKNPNNFIVYQLLKLLQVIRRRGQHVMRSGLSASCSVNVKQANNKVYNKLIMMRGRGRKCGGKSTVEITKV